MGTKVALSLGWPDAKVQNCVPKISFILISNVNLKN